MVDVLSKYYENEFLILETLAKGRISEFREYAELFPNDISHLKGYGIIEFKETECRIKAEPLQTWINRKLPSNIVNLQRDDEERLIGKTIASYKVEALIGHSSAFSNVYRAAIIEDCQSSSGKPNLVAIKVLKEGSILKLQREVDVLSKFDHPNIVKLITQGQTEDGKAYLVMEYLEGNSLRDRCQRSLRLSAGELKSLTVKLLDALVHIHPNEDKVNTLRQKPELTPNQFADLERARHGKIHRDIKPENIILTENRGPVLIDFNISVNAMDKVMTISHTPGYLPDDLILGQWTPDIDL